jgi:hypothetical protein
MPGVDQAYRTARQVRYDDKRAAVHRLVSSAFTKGVGHTYQTRCGEVLSAAGGAILTTRDVDCPGCVPGWKAG